MDAALPPSVSQIVVVGAGVGGLSAALHLAARGLRVTVLERGATVGGKARGERVGEQAFDTGPTVVTMPAVFEALFAAHGERLADHVALRRAEVLARHFFPGGVQLDLFADHGRSREAIARAFGEREAVGFDRFAAHAARVLRVVDAPFIQGQRPTVLGTMRAFGLSALPDLARIDGLRALSTALSDFFRAPALRQLFGRYATYVGSSPFKAPATLAVIAGVEMAGVYRVEGGVRRLVAALHDLALRRGVAFELGAEVARLQVADGRVRGAVLEDGRTFPADAVVFAGDAGALVEGRLGPEARRATTLAGERALSALTAVGAAVADAPATLSHHNVFFAQDSAAEFASLFDARTVPDDATLYVCAQDRGAELDAPPPRGPERILALLNAPALTAAPRTAVAARTSENEEPDGPWKTSDTSAWMQSLMDHQLSRAGLRWASADPVCLRGPADWAGLYPGSGGSLYGMASHGWRQAYLRPAARTQVKGLYLAGGTVHPGAGLPMAALSGARAAEALWADRPSTSQSRTTATPGGISMSSPTTAVTP